MVTNYNLSKYQAFTPVNLPDRTWPNQTITKAPSWCSVDLRDGNQALVNPLNIDQKIEFFKMLVAIGFKQIEIGFPAAAQVEADFCKSLMDQNLIPDDVLPQILCQARPHLINQTFDILADYPSFIFHLYNSTSTLQRKVVFKKDRKAIIKIATDATKLVKSLADQAKQKIVFQYSPESFTGTELEFAKDICEAVMDIWQPTADNPMILNLPATVELHTPNIHADQIEWFGRNVKNRDCYQISLHAHNDRGTGVAATELGLLAGADRVEGTLFGNGERTGNVDLIILALNMMTQGIDPKLDFTNLMEIRAIAERLTEIPVNERHPYSGDLVFTAFSGSHQDAINKGFTHQKKSEALLWEIPYLPIDPEDIGRSYEAIVRINSQSGKGGVAFILDKDFGYHLPKTMHPEVSDTIQSATEASGQEIKSQALRDCFVENFVNLDSPVELIKFKTIAVSEAEEAYHCELSVKVNNQIRSQIAKGNGPINAAKVALTELLNFEFHLLDFSQHTLSASSEAEAISYIQLDMGNFHKYGVGIDPNTNLASIRAMISALNRLLINNKNA